MKKHIISLIVLFALTINCYSQFIEPGISVGLNSYSGDLKRGYSPFPGEIGLEIFNRFNMSSHQTFKISYKKLNIKLELKKGYHVKHKIRILYSPKRRKTLFFHKFLIILKGSKHYAGLEEAMLKNIEACQKIAEIVKTSLGPNGKLF